MKKVLGALSQILDKAGAHAEQKRNQWASFEEALLNHRLVFDQFDFKKQIQIACDTAKGCAGRLSGKELPKFEDSEKTVLELKDRIGRTIAFLDTVTESDIADKEDSKVSLPYFPGKHLTGFEYAIEYALPNFYFHVATAYNILRANGVDIGKADYIGGLPLKEEV